jgi:hypothetical protein
MSYYLIADNIKAGIRISDIIAGLRFLKKQTFASKLEDAMLLIWYKNLTETESEMVSLIVNTMRAKLDGELDPDIDMADMYERIDVLDAK